MTTRDLLTFTSGFGVFIEMFTATHAGAPLRRTLLGHILELVFDVAATPGPAPLSDEDVPPPREWSAEPPGGLLALDLDWSARTRGAFEQLERIGAWERVIAYAQAMQMAEMASYATRESAKPGWVDAEQAEASAHAEVALVLHASEVTTAHRVNDARTLTERHPDTFAALHAGRVTLPKARIIAEQTAQLSDEQAHRVEARVLERATTQTPGQLRQSVRRAVARIDAEALIRRAQAQRAERGVWLHDKPDGMASLAAYLPAPDAVGAYAVLDELARAAAGPGEDRSMDARRVDTLVDLILDGVHTDCADTPSDAPPGIDSDTTATPQTGGLVGTARPHTWGPVGFVSAGSARAAVNTRAAHHGRPGARVNVQVRVTVPFTSLLGLDDAPGELAGYGPLPADVTRELAAAGTWRRILTDPESGALLDYGTTVYRPPKHLAEHVIIRDQTCGFPGCRAAAHRCDLDHRIAFDPQTGTGPTAEYNLWPLDRRHHQLKQTPGWSVTRDEDGTVTWTTPSRHHYIVPPLPLLDPEPPPKPEPCPDEPPF